jgi:hypothetical protein
MSQITQFLTVYGFVGGAIIVGLLLAGLRRAMQRASQISPRRGVAWSVVAVILVCWYGLVSFLAVHGIFKAAPGVLSPAIPLAVAMPVALGLLLVTRSETLNRVLDETPPAWLVRWQATRVIGAVFLILWAVGALPAQFALPAGIGDVLVGILSVSVAAALHRGAPGAITAAYAWNLLGMLDFVVALATGVMTSPGPLQVMAFDAPNRLASAYPLAMIPVFLVPLFWLMHFVSMRQLGRVIQHRSVVADVVYPPADQPLEESPPNLS